MTVSKRAIECKVSKTFRAKQLLLAMSPTDHVLKAFLSQYSVGRETVDSASIRLGMQEEFAQLIESCWVEFGPSDRYMKRTIMQFVRFVEKNGSEIESDSLASLVARASSVNTDGTPDALESCYVSFFLDRAGKNISCIPLKIRVFPYHNDVALRLWEAGNSLSEFLVANPDIVSGKALFELGSGCGATGLAIAAMCKPSKIHLTDYSEACQLNMEHNLIVNREWLSHHNFSPGRISQVSIFPLEDRWSDMRSL